MPDASGDAAVVPDAARRQVGCTPGRAALAHRSARLLYLLDRSSSMTLPLESGSDLSRWDAALETFGTTLPFTDELELGLLLFPTPISRRDPTRSELCAVGVDDALDVTPTLMGSQMVYDRVRDTAPDGATPTGAAVRKATRWLAAHQSQDLSQSIVLITDGAPNCNADAPDGCLCRLPSGVCGTIGSAARGACLDDQGTVAAIAEARTEYAIATYVIGIDGDLEAPYPDVLDRMADAGGRARAPNTDGGHRYLSVRDRAALAAAFERIQRTAARCTFLSASVPDSADANAIQIELGGRAVPRDTGHVEGWDWSDRTSGEITFYGEACTRAALLPAAQAPVAVVVCRES